MLALDIIVSVLDDRLKNSVPGSSNEDVEAVLANCLPALVRIGSFIIYRERTKQDKQSKN